MQKIIAVLFFLLPLAGLCQSDVLILQKNGRNIKTFELGMAISFQTVYDQWFDGTLTALRHDSVFINGIPFHYKEIRALRKVRSKLNYKQDGTILIAAGAGLLALSVINGLYSNVNSNEWFSTVSIVVSGALIVGGILLRGAGTKTYLLGKKYGLHYLDLQSDKPAEQQPVSPPADHVNPN